MANRANLLPGSRWAYVRPYSYSQNAAVPTLISSFSKILVSGLIARDIGRYARYRAFLS